MLFHRLNWGERMSRRSIRATRRVFWWALDLSRRVLAIPVGI